MASKKEKEQETAVPMEREGESKEEAEARVIAERDAAAAFYAGEEEDQGKLVEVEVLRPYTRNRANYGVGETLFIPKYALKYAAEEASPPFVKPVG